MANKKCKTCGTRHRDGSKIASDHRDVGHDSYQEKQFTKSGERGYRKSTGMKPHKSLSSKFGTGAKRKK